MPNDDDDDYDGLFCAAALIDYDPGQCLRCKRTARANMCVLRFEIVMRSICLIRTRARVRVHPAAASEYRSAYYCAIRHGPAMGVCIIAKCSHVIRVAFSVAF